MQWIQGQYELSSIAAWVYYLSNLYAKTNKIDFPQTSSRNSFYKIQFLLINQFKTHISSFTQYNGRW